MKIVVISDSHGNIANLKHVMGFAKKINASIVIHCGDWNNIETIKTVIEYKIPLYSVLGNADIDPNVEKLLHEKCKKFDQLFLNLEIDGRKIGVIHDLNQLMSNIGLLNILFCGHTHKQSDEMKDGLRVVNPGALVKELSFAVYDTDMNKVELINEQI